MPSPPIDDGPDNQSSATGRIIPDEDTLLAHINSCKTPPSLREIAKAFNIGQDKWALLRRLLRNMKDRGILADNRYAIVTSNTFPEVTVLEIIDFDNNGDAMARLIGTDNEKKVKIRVILGRRTSNALTVGQQILARLARVEPAIYEARIIRVLDRQQKRLFGVITVTSKGFRLQPTERGKRDSFAVKTPDDMTIKAGDLVEAKLLPSDRYIGKIAWIETNLGNVSSPGAFSALAIAEYGIRHLFPDLVIEEAKDLKVPSLKGRRDLRDHPLVTVDGADACDFDDAVFAEPANNGSWRLIIAIADVSHYVRQNSALDLEARKRGNSVYLPDCVVPMLPDTISNDLCSLQPNEDRAAMIAEIHIDRNGRRLSHQIERALIRSHARLTYDELQAVFDGTVDEVDYNLPQGILHALFGAWSALSKDREIREPLALKLKERRVLIDNTGNAIAISQQAQTESQRLIEDFMIAANVAAADTLIANCRTCVFRVHDTPDPKKVSSFAKIAKTIGGSFTTGQVLRPRHFNKILTLADDTPNEMMVNEAVLRCQAKAIYSIKNVGHFGLSLPNYAHFTSPIRRYADLLVHRALVDVGAGLEKYPKDGLRGMATEHIAEICSHISETEAKAAAAERRTIDRFAAALFETKIGDVVSGSIASVNSFGLFIRLENGAADGLLPLNALPDDFYDYNEQAQMIQGRQYGWRFSVGMPVRVTVTEVTPVSGGILLEWVEGGLKSDRALPRSVNREKKRFGKSAMNSQRLKSATGKLRSAQIKDIKRKRR